MRSYEAARNYFTFMSFLSWAVIIFGAIIAYVAASAIGEMSRGFGGSSLAGLTGLLPGIAVMYAGFMGVVSSQIGRTGVDTAEYSQQMLKIARDQLEVSRQSLNANNAALGTFAGRGADVTQDAGGASFSSLYDGASNGSSQNASTDTNAPQGRVSIMDPSLDTRSIFSPTKNELPADVQKIIEHSGQSILKRPDGYYVGDRVFADVGQAEAFIDQIQKRQS